MTDPFAASSKTLSNLYKLYPSGGVQRVVFNLIFGCI